MRICAGEKLQPTAVTDDSAQYDNPQSSIVLCAPRQLFGSGRKRWRRRQSRLRLDFIPKARVRPVLILAGITGIRSLALSRVCYDLRRKSRAKILRTGVERITVLPIGEETTDKATPPGRDHKTGRARESACTWMCGRHTGPTKHGPGRGDAHVHETDG